MPEGRCICTSAPAPAQLVCLWSFWRRSSLRQSSALSFPFYSRQLLGELYLLLRAVTRTPFRGFRHCRGSGMCMCPSSSNALQHVRSPLELAVCCITLWGKGKLSQWSAGHWLKAQMKLVVLSNAPCAVHLCSVFCNNDQPWFRRRGW